MQTAEPVIHELEYDAYQDRQYAEVKRPAIESRLELLGIGGRARWENGRWVAQPYPGFALQAMVDSTSANQALTPELLSIQAQITASPQREGALYPLPASSFHQTVANTFSANRLQHAVVAPGLLDTFHERIAEALDYIPTGEHESPPVMSLIGVSVFRTAIGVLGVFPDQSDFDRVIGFRNAFYGHTRLAAIGLKRTRPFIGHITLAYVEDPMSDSEKTRLANTIATLNDGLTETPLSFHMPRAELRRYDTLAAFEPDPRYPSYPL